MVRPDTAELLRYINLKLVALGQPSSQSTTDPYFLEIAGPLLRNYYQKDQLLGDRLCPADTLLADALETAATIAGNAPISTRQIKQSVNYGLNMDLTSGMMFEIEAYNRMVPTEDRREGIRAFNEKRKPQFQGR